MQIPFLSWLLQGVPESIAMVAFVFALASQPFTRKIILIGLLYGISAYIIRFLPFTPGVHMVILVFILAFLTAKYADIEFHKTILYSFLAFVLLMIYEMFFFWLHSSLNIVSPEKLKNDVMLRTITGLPQVIMMFITAWGIGKIRAK
ncbi:MAG: hypothetical protein ACOY3J_03175 [Bacillota bacterium]